MYIYDTKGQRWSCDIEQDDFVLAMRLHRKMLTQKSGMLLHGFSCYKPEYPTRFQIVRPEDVNIPMTMELVKPVGTPTLKGIG